MSEVRYCPRDPNSDEAFEAWKASRNRTHRIVEERVWVSSVERFVSAYVVERRVRVWGFWSRWVFVTALPTLEAAREYEAWLIQNPEGKRVLPGPGGGS